MRLCDYPRDLPARVLSVPDAGGIPERLPAETTESAL